jgi:class 3 adenylate cyclase
MLRLRLLRRLIEHHRAAPQRALGYAYDLNALAPDPSLAAEIGELAAQARQLAVSRHDQAAATAAVSGIAGSAQTGPVGPAPAEEVRRQVSVLAAEILTPFEDMQEEDPEAGLAIISPLIEGSRRELEQRGGLVLSSTDASIVGIFGARVATEDHAFQACNAALAMKAVAATSGESELRLSIGLDSGETVLRAIAAGEGEQLETQGTVVRTARRLAQALRRHAVVSTARMNDALVGSVTAQRIVDVDLAQLRLGECYEILAQNRVSSRWQLRRARGLAPLTGRGQELAYLNEVWRRVLGGCRPVRRRRWRCGDRQVTSGLRVPPLR